MGRNRVDTKGADYSDPEVLYTEVNAGLNTKAISNKLIPLTTPNFPVHNYTSRQILDIFLKIGFNLGMILACSWENPF